MEECSGEMQLRYKHSTAIQEVSMDDSSVENITISNALLEVLVQNPVCGRSDYSDLPGVRTSVWQRRNTLANSEERSRRNYEARIRREKLIIQRVAKRERLKAQQRERRRQRTLLEKLQQQTPEKGDHFLSNPGVIISSPKKGSPGKLLWRDNHRCDNKYQKKNSARTNTASKCDSASTVSSIKDTSDNNARDEIQTFLDEVVSTTSVCRPEQCIQDAANNSVSSIVANIGVDFLGECEENPVTSSSQDIAEKCLSHSSCRSPANDQSNKSISTSWTVTSTTAPEIADADSSTSKTLNRKTRNVKRVNYTEMFEEDDFDQDLEQRDFRESRTSGRKIRPVKRTLEKAIVDASLKKSPRKRKGTVEAKGAKCSLQCHSDSSSNTKAESDVLKKAKRPTKRSVPAVVERPNNVTSEFEQNQIGSNIHPTKTPGQPLPVSTASISQQHTLVYFNTVSLAQSPAQMPLQSVNSPVRHVYQSNLSCQPSLIPATHQFYTSPSGHNIQQNSAPVITSQSPYFNEINNFTSVMQPPFVKPSPVTNTYYTHRYPLNNSPSAGLSSQPHVLPSFPVTFTLPPRSAFVYDMNRSTAAFPNFLMEPQTFTSVSNSTKSLYAETSENMMRQEATASRDGKLGDNSARFVVMADTLSTKLALPVKKKRKTSSATSKNTSKVPPVTVQQQKSSPYVGTVVAQESMSSSQQHFLSTPIKSVGQSGSAVCSTPAMGSQSKDNAEIHSCKRQSQLDVETMLSSLHTAPAGGTNNGNSNNEICNRILQSSEIKTVQSQNFAKSLRAIHVESTVQTSTVHGLLTQQVPSSMHKPIGTAQNQLQSMSLPHVSQSYESPICTLSNQPSTSGNWAKSIGPPPPLINTQLIPSSIQQLLHLNDKQYQESDLRNFPLHLAFSHSNHSSISNSKINYQGVSLTPSNQSNNYPTSVSLTPSNQSNNYPGSVAPTMHPVSLTSHQADRIASHWSESSRQRSVITAQSNSTSQYKVSSSQLQHAQSQLSNPRHSNMTFQSDPTKHVQENSKSKQKSMPRMPALLGPLNCSVTAGNDTEGYQRIRMHVPEYPHTIQSSLLNKHTAHSIRSPTNAAPERRAAPRMITNLTQVPRPQQNRTDLEKHTSNTLGMLRMLNPQSPVYKPVGATAQHNNFQGQRQTLVPNSRVQVLNQQSPAACHEASASDFWRLPLFRQQEFMQPMSDKSAVDQLYSSESARNISEGSSQLHFNQQRVQSNTIHLTSANCPENTTDTHLLSGNSMMQKSSMGERQQGSYSMISQQVMDSASKMDFSKSVQRHDIASPYKSPEVSKQREEANSALKLTVQAVTVGVQALEALQTVDLKPARSILLQALDLSHKSTHAGQIQTTLPTLTLVSSNSSVTTVSSWAQGNLTTPTVTASRVAYDYPLTKVQIKQEFLSKPEQSEDYSDRVLQPGLQKSQTSVRAEVSPITVDRTLSVTSMVSPTLPSAHSYQYGCPVTRLETVQPSTEGTYSQTPTASQPSVRSSAMERINIKVEAHLNSEENSQPVTSSLSTVTNVRGVTSSHSFQVPLVTTTSQIPQTAVITSGSLITSLSTNLRSSSENIQHVESGSGLCGVGNKICPANNTSAGLLTVVKGLLPAHSRIMNDLHSEKSTDTSVPLTQSSDLNSALSSSTNVLLASVAHDSCTSISERNTSSDSDSSTTVAVVSREMILLKKDIQPSNSMGHQNDSVQTSAFQGATVHNQESIQPENIKVKGEHVLESTFKPGSGSLSTKSPPEQVTQVIPPSSPSAVTPTSEMSTAIQMNASAVLTPIHHGSHDKNGNTESCLTKLAFAIPPLQSIDPPSKQPATKTNPHKSSMSNDPLFAWYIDSPKQHMDSLLVDDITTSLSQYDEQSILGDTSFVSNFYTVTVSVPCAEGGNTLYSHTDATDVPAVKVEPNTQPATLNQREVIDLSVSDNDEDDPVDIDAPSYESLCQDSSIFQNTPYFDPKEAAETGRSALSTSETGDKHIFVNIQTPYNQSCSISLNSDLHDVALSQSLERTTVSISPGQSKFVAGQVSKSPLTIQNVMSGEHVSSICNHLTRLSTDVSSVISHASSGDSASENSKVSSVMYHSIPLRKESVRSAIDSVTKASGSEQTHFTKDVTLTTVSLASVQPTYTPVAESKEQKNMLSNLEINTGESSSARKKMHGIVIKTEYDEPICLDDDEGDCENISSASSGMPQLPSDVIKNGNPSRITDRHPSNASSSSVVSSHDLSTSSNLATSVLSPQKDQQSPVGSKSSLLSPNRGSGQILASIANWSNEEVSDWLNKHKLDKICPNFSNLDGRGLQRMAFEHHRDPDMFYARVKKTLGLTFFQTMVICHSMKELNDGGTDDV